MVMMHEPFPDADQVPVTTCQTGRLNENLERFLLIGGPFTPAQREWCLAEISSVGGFDRREYENASDKDLGRGVVSVWARYNEDEQEL